MENEQSTTITLEDEPVIAPSGNLWDSGYVDASVNDEEEGSHGATLSDCSAIEDSRSDVLMVGQLNLLSEREVTDGEKSIADELLEVDHSKIVGDIVREKFSRNLREKEVGGKSDSVDEVLLDTMGFPAASQPVAGGERSEP